MWSNEQSDTRNGSLCHSVKMNFYKGVSSVSGSFIGAVPGTEGKVTLESGTTLDRYGSQYGRYFTNPGTPANQLALTPKNTYELTTYVVKRSFTVSTGVVANCSWGVGGGFQYFSWMSAKRLVMFGFLAPVG